MTAPCQRCWLPGVAGCLAHGWRPVAQSPGKPAGDRIELSWLWPSQLVRSDPACDPCRTSSWIYLAQPRVRRVVWLCCFPCLWESEDQASLQEESELSDLAKINSTSLRSCSQWAWGG